MIQLTCQLPAYEGLHKSADSKAEIVKVNKDALKALLLDHGRLLKECQHITKEA